MIEIVEQTEISRKKAKKKAKVMHVNKRGRRCVCLNRIFFFFSFFFQSNLSLIGTEASPFGGEGGRHHFTCLDVDPPTMPTYLPTYCIRRYE